MEDNSLIKLTKIYSQKLEEDLKPILKKVEDLPLSYKSFDLEKYDFFYFNIFIEILRYFYIFSCKIIYYILYISLAKHSLSSTFIKRIFTNIIK